MRLYDIPILTAIIASGVVNFGHATEVTTHMEGEYLIIDNITGITAPTMCRFSPWGGNGKQTAWYYRAPDDQAWEYTDTSALGGDPGMCATGEGWITHLRLIIGKKMHRGSVGTPARSLAYGGANYSLSFHAQWHDVGGGGGPTPGGSCVSNQPASIDFKTMPANDIPTAPIGTSVLVTCTKNSKVSAKFVFGDGTDNNNLANGLNVKLLVGGWPGQQGFTYNANKDMPVTIYVNAMLSASGTVREGIFRTIGVVKLSYD